MKRRFVFGYLVGTMVAPDLLAQGLTFGADTDKTLKYRLQDGSPRTRDRYVLMFKTLPAPTRGLQVLYESNFDGQIDPTRISVYGSKSETAYATKTIDLDRTARALTIQFAQPIPQGEMPEIRLDEVFNPSVDGVYQFRGRYLSNGPFPAFLYIGDWFITIGIA
ncbi:DUF2808 domain-containing protein [Anthocerotibacter panamensis]|uniref:DUF2808 domain-containing protein n=1 Tax=Anthocerotibacter panamensis TaxID=2857077 RepID=UPI001C405649|nr:DUF2808 domain-containing protein [Anthocerotibacter panamensis]